MKILICDDHPIVWAGMRAALPEANWVEVREPDGVPSALERNRDVRLILMDLLFQSGPGEPRGLAAIVDLRKRVPHVPIVAISQLNDDATITAAYRAGAAGFIGKNSSPDLMRSVVRRILEFDGAGLRSGGTAPSGARTTVPWGRLSASEARLIPGVASGMTNAELGAKLGKSARTVQAQLRSIFQKLGVSSRVELVSLYIRDRPDAAGEQGGSG